MKFKNSEILSSAERDIILQEARIRCREYEIPERMIFFKMNKELKETSGYVRYFFNPEVTHKSQESQDPRGRKVRFPVEINISAQLYREEGFKAVVELMRTLLAKIIFAYKYGSEKNSIKVKAFSEAFGGGDSNERIL